MLQDGEETQLIGSTPKMICHVFESEEVNFFHFIKNKHFSAIFILWGRTPLPPPLKLFQITLYLKREVSDSQRYPLNLFNDHTWE